MGAGDVDREGPGEGEGEGVLSAKYRERKEEGGNVHTHGLLEMGRGECGRGGRLEMETKRARERCARLHKKK